MAGNKTTWLSNSALAHFLKAGTDVAQPTALYLALFTADPTNAGAYTNEIPNSNGYQRMAVTFTTATTGTTSNNADILWPAYTGTNNPVVTYVALVDSPTIGAGNMYYHAPASPSQTLAQNAQFKVASGTFTVTES